MITWMDDLTYAQLQYELARTKEALKKEVPSKVVDSIAFATAWEARINMLEREIAERILIGEDED